MKFYLHFLIQHILVILNLLSTRPGLKQWGAHNICKDFESLNIQATGYYIKLSYSKHMRLTTGGKTKAQSNAEKSWLLDVEIEVVIAYIGEIGNQGFSLSHKWLKEHVDAICQACLGELFPTDGVGKNWMDHFIEKHSEAIKMSWSQPLKQSVGGL